MAILDLDNVPSAAFAASISGSPAGGSGSARMPTGGDVCASCMARCLSRSPTTCDRCRRKLCSDCASESMTMPMTGAQGQLCDDCYFAVRDQDFDTLDVNAGQRNATTRLIKMLPAHWRQNFGPLLSLASRSYFLRIVETLRSLCTVAAVGHLGIEELGALALAKSMIVMTQGPITSALVTNIDRILCRILHSFEGQRPTSARASRVAEEAGLWLQRAAVMLVCAAFGLALVWQAAWHAWKTVGLSDSMCEQAIEFLRVSILGLVPEMLLPLAAVCMLAQGYEAPINGGAIIGVLCHVFLTVIMVYAWEWGIKGAALAGVLSSWLQLVVVLGHICVQNLHEHTWVGFSMEAFLPEPLYALFLAAAPLAWASSNLVLISQIPLLLAASLGPRALGTYVAIEYLSAIFVQVPYALSHASLFKISSQLRSGNGRAAKGTAWLCLFMSLASGLCCSLAILAFSEALSLFFSHDGDVIEDVVQLLPLMALWQVWYGFSMVCYSVLEASGNQRYSLWLKVVSGVLVTMPLSCLMIYAADVGILGLLWSVIFGQAVGALQGFLRVKALDWASLAAKFRMRTLQILRSSAMPYSGMSRTAGAGKGDATRADSACGAGGDGGDRGGGGGCGGLVVPGDMGFDFIAPDGFFYSEEALLEVAQLQSSLLDDLHMENDGEDRGQALQPVSTTLEGAWGQSGGASRGYLLVKAQEEGLAGVEMHEICIGTPSKGHLGCGRGQERGAGKGELRTEERLLSVGRASVRSAQLHMLRCEMERSRALSRAVLPRVVGDWFSGPLTDLEKMLLPAEVLGDSWCDPGGGKMETLTDSRAGEVRMGTSKGYGGASLLVEQDAAQEDEAVAPASVGSGVRGGGVAQTLGGGSAMSQGITTMPHGIHAMSHGIHVDDHDGKGLGSDDRLCGLDGLGDWGRSAAGRSAREVGSGFPIVAMSLCPPSERFPLPGPQIETQQGVGTSGACQVRWEVGQEKRDSREVLALQSPLDQTESAAELVSAAREDRDGRGGLRRGEGGGNGKDYLQERQEVQEVQEQELREERLTDADLEELEKELEAKRSFFLGN